MKAIVFLTAALILAGSVSPDFRGFSEYRRGVIEDVLDDYDDWLPDGLVLTFYNSDRPGAHATCGVGERANHCTIRLGHTVWSRARSVEHGYPTFGARSDDELARIVVGHELGHLTLTEEEVSSYHRYTGGDDEEAFTVFSLKVQRLPLRLYENNVSRRFQMYRWWSATRARRRLP